MVKSDRSLDSNVTTAVHQDHGGANTSLLLTLGTGGPMPESDKEQNEDYIKYLKEEITRLRNELEDVKQDRDKWRTACENARSDAQFEAQRFREQSDEIASKQAAREHRAYYR